MFMSTKEEQQVSDNLFLTLFFLSTSIIQDSFLELGKTLEEYQSLNIAEKMPTNWAALNITFQTYIRAPAYEFVGYMITFKFKEWFII